MTCQRISALLALSLLASPLPLPSDAPPLQETPNSSPRASLRRMKHLLASAPTLDLAAFAQNHCLNEGTLQKTRDYVYVKLNDGYLTTLFNEIKKTNPNIKRARFRGKIGPHFSVIRHDEWKGMPPQKIAEIGNTYTFVPVRLDVVETARKRLWVLIVEPNAELAALRARYAKSPLPHGHAYHITLAQEAF